MIRKITMTTFVAGALALGLSAAAQAAPAGALLNGDVRTAVLDGNGQASAQQVHWRRHHWRGYRYFGWRRHHHWRRWW